MTKPLIGIIAVVVIAAGAYLVWSRTPVSQDVVARGTPVVMDMQTATVSEETENYTITGEYPIFGVPEIDAAIEEVVDNAIASFKAYPSDTPSVDSIPKNSQDISYDSVYTGSDYVSVELLVSEYTGGAHPNTVIIGANVMPNGTKVTLDDALALIGKSLKEVASETDAELKLRLENAYFADGSAPIAENYSTFLINESSVIFVFNPYQVGPYAAGPQEVAFDRVR